MTNQIPLGLSDYQSYRNLPALAGLGTMTDAMGIGLSEECVRRLKRITGPGVAFTRSSSPG